jgi:hypothetical protein
LELSDINVESTIETKGGGQRGDDLSYESVQVGVGGSVDIEGTLADVVECLIVEHEGNIGVLKQRVGREHRVVGLHNCGGDLGRGVNAEVEFAFLSIINGESLEKKRAETRSCSSSNGVEDEESLETSALVGKLPDSIKAEIHNLLADGVMTTGIVVCGILLSGDELLRVEQLTVSTSADLINNSRLEVKENSTGNVLSSSSLGEEGVKGIITISYCLIRGHLTIGLNSVLKAIKLPAGVTNLGSSLTNVDGNNFTHFKI